MAFVLFLLSLALVVKSAQFAITYSSSLARGLGLTRYSMGFLVIAFISILPETFIALISAAQGNPEFGLGTLFGSNVADLTFVFFMTVLATKNGLFISEGILHKNRFYLPVLALPLLLGWDGAFTRVDGALLILLGGLFYYYLIRKDCFGQKGTVRFKINWRHLAALILSMALLLISANWTVHYGTSAAEQWGLHPVLISLIFVGLGTTLPEMFFAIQAVRKKHYGLATGDLLGTVISDATMVVGAMVLIQPFSFDPFLIYGTGMAMLVSGVMLFWCMHTGKRLSVKEGAFLFFIYLVFIAVEVSVRQIS